MKRLVDYLNFRSAWDFAATLVVITLGAVVVGFLVAHAYKMATIGWKLYNYLYHLVW